MVMVQKEKPAAGSTSAAGFGIVLRSL